MTGTPPPSSPSSVGGPPSPLSQSSAPMTPRKQVAPVAQLPHPHSAPSAFCGSPNEERASKRNKIKKEKTPSSATLLRATPAPVSSRPPTLSDASAAASMVPSSTFPASRSDSFRRSLTATSATTIIAQTPRRGTSPNRLASTASPSSSRLPPAFSPLPPPPFTPASAQQAQPVAGPPGSPSSGSLVAQPRDAARQVTLPSNAAAHLTEEQPADTGNTTASEGNVAIELPGESEQSAVVISDDDDANGNDTHHHYGSASGSNAMAERDDEQQPVEAANGPVYISIRLLDGTVSLTAGLFQTLPQEFRQAFHPLSTSAQSSVYGKYTDEYLLEETSSTFSGILDWFRDRVLPASASQRACLRKRVLRLGLNSLARQLQQAPTWTTADGLQPGELEDIEKSLVLSLLGCDALQDFAWADGDQDGVDVLASFQATIQRVERHLQDGRRGPCRIDWRAVWGSPRYWPFWWHVQGPDEGKSTWNLAQQAKPALARAILVDGEVPAPPPQTQQMGSQSRDAADDEDGEVVATCQKDLRVEYLIDAMSYRLLRNGIRLEELTFIHAKEELWIQASPFDPIPA